MNLADTIKGLKKTHGENAIITLNEVQTYPPFSTGVFAIDAYIGGGLRRGRITRLVGEYSSGKSTLALKTAANAQHMDRFTDEPLIYEDNKAINPATGEVASPNNVVYLDLEQSFEPQWAKTLGVTDNLHLISAQTQEQAFDMLADLLQTTEVDLLIVDSLAAMAPKKELEASMSDAQMGLSAKNNNRALRVITGLFGGLVQNNHRPPAVIIINQIREKIGVMFGSPNTLPGGRGQDFFAAIDIEVRAESLSKSDKEDDLVVARESTFSIKKNKQTGLYGKGKFKIFVQDTELFHKGDTDEPIQVVDILVARNIIEKTTPKSNYFIVGDETLNGKNNLMVYLLERPELYQMYKQKAVDELKAMYG